MIGNTLRFCFPDGTVREAKVTGLDVHDPRWLIVTFISKWANSDTEGRINLNYVVWHETVKGE